MVATQTTRRHPSLMALVGIVLAVWLAGVLVLGASGAFARPPGTVPVPIILSVTVPIPVFLVCFEGPRELQG